MPRAKKHAEPQRCADTACQWCEAGRPDFCAALRAFSASPSAERWKDLRSKCIPNARGSFRGLGGRSLMGETVWQALCRSEGIRDLSGGRFHDGGVVPTPDDIAIALVVALASGEAR